MLGACLSYLVLLLPLHAFQIIDRQKATEEQEHTLLNVSKIINGLSEGNPAANNQSFSGAVAITFD